MDESHENCQSHVGQSIHSCDFPPPYYPDQTIQSPVPSLSRHYYPCSVATLETGPVEVRRASDEQAYDALEYAPDFTRQRLVYTPLTPPLTPQKSQLGRGHYSLFYDDTSHIPLSETLRDPHRRESWPLSHSTSHPAPHPAPHLASHPAPHPAATTPVYIRTSPPPWSGHWSLTRRQQGEHMEEEEERQRCLEESKRAHERYPRGPRDDMTRFPLQDPPKSKFKRQLSEDSTEIRSCPLTTYSNNVVPPQSPRPANSAPRTPQPESAHKAFSFNFQDDRSGRMSPKGAKNDCISHSIPPSNTIDRGQFQSDMSGNRSPKRVKGENGSARPPMSPLVQAERNKSYCSNFTQGRSDIASRENDLVFQYPDVNNDPGGYDASVQVPLQPTLVYIDPTTNKVYPVDWRILQDRKVAYKQKAYSGDYVSQLSRVPQPQKRPSPQRNHHQEKHSPQKCQRTRCSWCEAYQAPFPLIGMSQGHMMLSPKRQQPLRSQSNIDHSPCKKELEEAEREKYLRSISKPEGQSDLNKVQRQYVLKRNAHNDVNPQPHCTGPISDCAWIEERRGACRQLSFARETELCGQAYIGRPRDIDRQVDMPRGYLQHSYDDCDIYVVPRATDTLTSLPDTSATESDVGYMQQRRQTISCSRNVNRHYSPMKGRSSPGKNLPKGEVKVRLNCHNVAENIAEFSQMLKQPQQTSISCKCESVKAEILKIAKTAFTNGVREDSSKEAFERSQQEIRETNALLRDALATANSLRELCGRHRKINDIYSGSVVIAMQCGTLASLESLREMYKTGELKQFLYRTFVTERLRKTHGFSYALMSVTIDETDFERCKNELEATVFQTSRQYKKRVLVPKLSPLKRETKSVEDLENIPSCPQSPVHMRSSISTPVLMTSSPLSSPSYFMKSPSTPTKRERIFSFSTIDRRSKRKSSNRERKYSLNTPGDLSPRRYLQSQNPEEPPRSPSKKTLTINENEAYRQQSSSRLRKSLEDITSDFANVSVQQSYD